MQNNGIKQKHDHIARGSADERRMRNIHSELQQFISEFKNRHFI